MKAISKVMSCYQSRNLRYDFECILEQLMSNNFNYLPHKKPNPDSAGRIITLNHTGFMCTKLDSFTLAFVNSAKHAQLPVLEIGASYGIASQKALDNGAIVVANDLDLRHLFFLKQQIKPQDWARLYLNNKRFSDATNFPNNSFSHILLSRVAHFLKPDSFEIGLQKLYKWLVPGGEIYFVIMSPFHPRLSWFLPVYEKRWKNGVKWPGEIKNVKDSWPPELSKYIPNYLHVMDDRPFRHAVQKIGFQIKELTLFQCDNAKKTYNNNNKEYLGAIITK